MSKIHVVSLPHTLLTREYEYCAFSAKVWRLSKMLAMESYPAVIYGPDIYDSKLIDPGVEYVPIVTEAERVKWFGSPEWDKSRVFDRWNPIDSVWVESNLAAANAIEERWYHGDIIGNIAGGCQSLISERLNHLNPLTCEWGIGYQGIMNYSHKVFESYAWAHHLAGKYGDDKLKFFDTVIPNCYDLNDFTPNYDIPQDPYLLFMGRPDPTKGLAIVEEIAKRVDMPVIVAGQPGHAISNVEYVGLVTGEDKKQLLANAYALLAPTVYLEPFGGVAVEAMLSGTPVISTDWGGFTETVQNGVSGYRCRTLAEFVVATEFVADLDRRKVREYAQDRYTLEVGSPMYSYYFENLSTLYGDGWYSL